LRYLWFAPKIASQKHGRAKKYAPVYATFIIHMTVTFPVFIFSTMANSRRSYSLKDKRDIVRAVDCRIDKSYFIQLHVGVMCGVSVM
jgi:hypothetical protein